MIETAGQQGSDAGTLSMATKKESPPSPSKPSSTTTPSARTSRRPSTSRWQGTSRRPKQIRYPRNTDLDPQLVWRGKDEQDWSDLVVNAPPLYIQEKVHPKVLIDDLLRTDARARA
jgi:adenine-specific DNA-methyltransferase